MRMTFSGQTGWDCADASALASIARASIATERTIAERHGPISPPPELPSYELSFLMGGTVPAWLGAGNQLNLHAEHECKRLIGRKRWLGGPRCDLSQH